MLWLIVCAVIFIFAVGFLYRVTYPALYDVVEKIPGPKTVPIFGNTLEFKMDMAETTKVVLNWYEKYGSPMRVKFGPLYSVHLFKAEHVEVILKHMTNLKKSMEYDYVEEWLGNGLLISTGNKWHKRRKLLTPSFHFNILQNFAPIMNENAKVLVDVLSEAGNGPIDMAPLLTKCTLDIICETAMGLKIDAQRKSSTYVDALGEFADLVTERSMRPWLWFAPLYRLLPSGKRFYHCLNVLHSFTRKVVADREASLKNVVKGSKRLAFLDLLLDLKSEGKIDSEGIREEVDTFMFEGHDTTATGLMWAVWCLASNEKWQNEVYDEIIEFAGGDRNGEVTSEMISGMKLFERVLKESQRLVPSVPVVGRTVTEPFYIEDQLIPAGVSLAIGIMQLHRNPEVFPEPLKFDPDRFLPENVQSRHPFAFLPFSAGPRNCIGQKFALLEEKIILVHLIRNFKFIAMEKFEDMKPSMTLVLKPLNGIWVKVESRQ